MSHFGGNFENYFHCFYDTRFSLIEFQKATKKINFQCHTTDIFPQTCSQVLWQHEQHKETPLNFLVNFSIFLMKTFAIIITCYRFRVVAVVLLLLCKHRCSFKIYYFIKTTTSSAYRERRSGLQWKKRARKRVNVYVYGIQTTRIFPHLLFNKFIFYYMILITSIDFLSLRENHHGD